MIIKSGKMYYTDNGMYYKSGKIIYDLQDGDFDYILGGEEDEQDFVAPTGKHSKNRNDRRDKGIL